MSLVGFPTKKMHNKKASFELENLFVRDQGSKVLTAREHKIGTLGFFISRSQLISRGFRLLRDISNNVFLGSAPFVVLDLYSIGE